MLDWNDLKYVLALRDGGTMKRAAAFLKTDPTTVSRHIKRISTQLNADLFHLSKGGQWSLTPRGTELTILAQQFRDNLNRLHLGDTSLGESETVVITSLEFVLAHYLAPRVLGGIKSFPDTKISLLGSDKRLSLAYGEADIALRFGRPTEGQLLTSKVADVSFDIFIVPGYAPDNWIGMAEGLDWTPEMRLGFQHFGAPPRLRVSSFAAAREAAIATGFAAVGPGVIMRQGQRLEPMAGAETVTRSVWSVIHETRRYSQRLLAVRDWIRTAVLEAQSQDAENVVQIPALPNLRGRAC